MHAPDPIVSRHLSSARRIACAALVAVAVASASVATSFAQGTDEPIPTPPPAGVDVQTWSSSQVIAERRRVAVRLDVPAAWTVNTDVTSTLFEPQPNPLDLGAVVIVGSTSDLAPELATADGAAEMLGTLVERPKEIARDSVDIDVLGGAESATLITVEATFDDGRPAHMRVLHLAWNDLVLIVMVGVSDDGHGPWQGVLDDILSSTRLVDPTRP